MKRYLIIMIFSVVSILAMAQRTDVTGRVTDGSGEPLAGVFVLEKDTDNGTSTDASGRYSIKVPSDASLIFTSIGFKELVVPVSGYTIIDITLEVDSQMLDETVVIGYGSQKSRDLTAPIVNIKGDDLTRHVASSPMSGIQGRVPGVQITGSGAPGASPSVKIRGSGSIGDYAQPLYIVDGAFVDNLDFISPNDIEDMTVLKDASASAIYGVRAANGVVIITTRRGAKGAPAILYDGYVGVQIPVNVMKLANKSQYIGLLNEANSSVPGYQPKDPSKFPAGVDWYSVLLRNAMTQNHSLGVSGATDKTNYSAGLSYFNQEGILNAENAYDRLNFRSKLDQTVTSWLSVGVNIVLSRYTRTSSDNNAFFQAFVNPPVYNIYNDSNEAAYPVKYDSPQLYGFGNSYANPVAVARYNENSEKGTNLVFSTYAQLSFLNGKLNFKTSYNLDFQSYRNQSYVPEYFVGGSQGVTVSTLTKIYGQKDRHVIDNTLTYTDRISKHRFSVMAGQSTRIERFSALNGSGINVPNYDAQSLYIDNGSNSGSSIADTDPAPYQYRGVSFFTRAAYNYADRYLATLTFRADGSSKYNKKWGFFPSVGLGWVLTSEPFMEDYDALDFLKLRASWGMLGNDNVPANSTVILGNIGTSVSGVFGDNLVDGIGAQTVYQNYLKWEVVNEFDVGVDFTFMEGRFSGELDYYNRTTDNVVFYAPIATGGGTAELLSNNGTVRNSGFELSVGWSDFVGENFTYNIGFNLTTVSNKVVELQGREYIPGASVRGNYTTRTQVGLPIGAFWGYEVDGVFASEQEVLNYPIQQEVMAPGYFKYKDIDGNNIINENDKSYLGSPIPKITGGLDLGFAWKNLDFGITLYCQLGNKVLNAKRMNRDVFTDGNYDLNFYQNAWRPGRLSDTYPSAAAYNTAFVQQANSFFVEDASYFRIQNVQFGYTFRNFWKINALRLYFSAQRPLAVFRYNGFTPEVGGSPIANGIDTSTYPMQAICTLGLKMSF